MRGEPLEARYAGYTSCPHVIGFGRLVLAEYDYEESSTERFPFDQSKVRRSIYLLKRYGLPAMYWHGMLWYARSRGRKAPAPEGGRGYDGRAAQVLVNCGHQGLRSAGGTSSRRIRVSPGIEAIG